MNCLLRAGLALASFLFLAGARCRPGHSGRRGGPKVVGVDQADPFARRGRHGRRRRTGADRPGAASPHTYSLKPSDAEALQAADIVFWVGPNLETFLVRPMQTLASDATSVELSKAPGVTTLPLREGGAFEADDDAPHQGAGGHGAADMHVWLDPVNAKAMVDAIAAALGKADPEHAARSRRMRRPRTRSWTD